MTSTQPNILLIVSDDHGYADRSAVGLKDAATPNLDRLAAEGTSFTNAYVTAPICSPSRAAMITGQYQQRWGATWFDSSDIGTETTIAERLGARGYATGYFGKIHYGDEGPGDRGTPPKHGFDESFYGLAGQSMGRLHYLKHSRQAVADYGEAAEAMAVQPLWEGEHEVEGTGFLTEEIADRASRFIEAHQSEPFFAMVAFNAVHNFCWQLPEDERKARGLEPVEDWHPGASEYLDWYDGAISPNLENGRGYYAAQLELMDRHIGRVLDRLDELGLAEDTIVVYLTDNGGSTCNYGDNSPLRGTKYTLWEGGIRVPYIVRWPGVARAGIDNDSLVSSLDLASTFLAAADDAADTEAPVTDAPIDTGLDGLDLAKILRGGPAHEELHWDCEWQWAVRAGNYKLSWCDADSGTAHYVREVEHTSPGDGYFLAALDNDPGEQNNLADTHPEIVERLALSHRRWREEVGLGRSAQPASDR